MNTIVAVSTVTPGTYVRFGGTVGLLTGARCWLPSSEPGYWLNTPEYGPIEVGPNAVVQLLGETGFALYAAQHAAGAR